jgi:hypothetical protein
MNTEGCTTLMHSFSAHFDPIESISEHGSLVIVLRGLHCTNHASILHQNEKRCLTGMSPLTCVLLCLWRDGVANDVEIVSLAIGNSTEINRIMVFHLCPMHSLPSIYLATPSSYPSLLHLDSEVICLRRGFLFMVTVSLLMFPCY